MKVIPDTKKVTAKPEFNSGISYVERIHILFSYYHLYKVSKELDSACECLKGVAGELYPRASKKQQIELKSYIQKTNEILFNVKKQDSLGVKNINTASTLMTNSESFFLVVSVIAHNLGLIMPDKADVRDSMGL